MRTKQKRTSQIFHHKILFTVLGLLVVVGLPQSSLGQEWSTNGNNISNTNTGNVGMGTTTPYHRVEVAGGGASIGFFPGNTSAYGTNAILSRIIARSNYGSVDSTSAAEIKFLTGSNAWYKGQIAFFTNNYDSTQGGNTFERMRITEAGNIGIGTTAPANQLHINNASGAATLLVSGSGNGIFNLQDTAAPVNAKLFQWRAEGGVFRMTSVNDAWSGYVQQNILVASANGNIGMGTSNPTSLQGGLSGLSGRVFQIQNNAGMAQLDISSAGAGNVSALGFEVGDGTATKRLLQQVYIGASNAFKFRTLNEATGALTQDNILVLKNTGNIGVGIAEPGYRLDVQGGQINTSEGLCIAGDCKTAWSQVGSQWTTSGTTINYATGNVGIGTATPTEKLDVNGNIKVSGNINAKYQDVAEWVESSQELGAGTVVVLDAERSNQVIASTESYDTRVAGVISAQPGITLGEDGEGKVLVATTGRVKIKVSARNGPIGIGDLLVTSDQPGVAMRSQAVNLGGVLIHRPGTLIGKALEPLAQGTGEILVLLSLQ